MSVDLVNLKVKHCLTGKKGIITKYSPISGSFLVKYSDERCRYDYPQDFIKILKTDNLEANKQIQFDIDLFLNRKIKYQINNQEYYGEHDIQNCKYYYPNIPQATTLNKFDNLGKNSNIIKNKLKSNPNFSNLFTDDYALCFLPKSSYKLSSIPNIKGKIDENTAIINDHQSEIDLFYPSISFYNLVTKLNNKVVFVQDKNNEYIFWGIYQLNKINQDFVSLTLVSETI